MSFEDDPKDERQEFPCECGGTISQDEHGAWRCDECDFSKTSVQLGAMSSKINRAT